MFGRDDVVVVAPRSTSMVDDFDGCRRCCTRPRRARSRGRRRQRAEERGESSSVPMERIAAHRLPHGRRFHSARTVWMRTLPDEPSPAPLGITWQHPTGSAGTSPVGLSAASSSCSSSSSAGRSSTSTSSRAIRRRQLSISTATVPSTVAGTTQRAARRNLEGRERVGGPLPHQRDGVRTERYRGRPDEPRDRLDDDRGTKVTAATFTVDMTTISSDKSQRDGQFQGRIMDTADFPTATFTLTSPIELSPVPKDGVQKTYVANGSSSSTARRRTSTLTLNTSRPETRSRSKATTTITFSDYNIDNPSGGPASVGNSGRTRVPSRVLAVDDRLSERRARQAAPAVCASRRSR